MLQYFRLFSFNAFLLFWTSSLGGVAFAHGGGLDSSGGHNCYVGSCAGTYHSHRSQSSNLKISESVFWEVVLLVFLAFIFFAILKASKEKADNGNLSYKITHFIISLCLVFGFMASAMYLLA